MKSQKTRNELNLIEEFERFIRDCRRGRRLQPGGKKLCAGTITNYDYTLHHLRRFSAQQEMILRIRPVRWLNGRELIAERKYWKKFYTGFTAYLYDECGCYDNYVGQLVKNIKIQEMHKTKNENDFTDFQTELLQYITGIGNFMGNLKGIRGIPKIDQVKTYQE